LALWNLLVEPGRQVVDGDISVLIDIGFAGTKTVHQRSGKHG
jgi:phage repressor protein C with HTH and peptisase S24 domain